MNYLQAVATTYLLALGTLALNTYAKMDSAELYLPNRQQKQEEQQPSPIFIHRERFTLDALVEHQAPK